MAKRISLREFQQNLSMRLTSAGQAGQAAGLLGVESGNDRWLLNLAEAGEVIPSPPISDVPLTRSWYLGLTNVRGVLFSVVDLARFHGQESTPVNSQARLLLVGNRYGLKSALLATRAAGLKRQEDLEFLGNDTDPNRPWAGDRYRDPAGVEWRQLRVQALLASPAFLDIAL